MLLGILNSPRCDQNTGPGGKAAWAWLGGFLPRFADTMANKGEISKITPFSCQLGLCSQASQGGGPCEGFEIRWKMTTIAAVVWWKIHGLVRWKAHFDLCQWNLLFSMSRAPLLAHHPLHSSAECATPTNTSLFEICMRNLANAPAPSESFCTWFIFATHAHPHFFPRHWLLCHLGLY